ncbi:MAG TPA: YciI family protein [Ramlibacter sp.]|nr:YciI family protein [Ramlibacter sp.]
MKYLCLAFYDPAKFAAMPPDEVKAMVSQCPAKDAQLKATGQLLVSASLGGAEQAMTIRPRGGKPAVTDGPYAEAKEVVGGFFLIEAADKEEALRIASLHPAATLGEQAGWGIEVHPVDMYLEHGTSKG